MLKVGLTGGIGSGKTTVCRIFEQLGIPVFYADSQAKHLLEHDDRVKQQVIERFGKEVYAVGGTLRRNTLADMVFSNSPALKALNAIVHPAVRQRFSEWTKTYSHCFYVIKEAAILFEAGAEAGLDVVITVHATRQLRMLRVMERDGVTEEQVLQRMSRQSDDDDKMRRADYVIYNDETRLVIPQILNIHEDIVSKANP